MTEMPSAANLSDDAQLEEDPFDSASDGAHSGGDAAGARVSVQSDRDISQGSQHHRGVVGADLGSVFLEGDITQIVDLVLIRPVHLNMRRALPDASKIGFTGTPA